MYIIELPLVNDYSAMAFDSCVQPCIQHCNQDANSSITPVYIPSAAPFVASLFSISRLWQSLICSSSLSFCLFQKCHRNEIIQCEASYVWFLLLSKVHSRILHVTASVRASFCFSWLSSIPLYRWLVGKPQLVYPCPSWGSFGWFLVLVIMGKAAVNSCVQSSVWIQFHFSGKYLKAGLVGHRLSMLDFTRNPWPALQSGCVLHGQ